MTDRILCALLASATALLIACGGGGTDSPDTGSPDYVPLAAGNR
jgi:outer membrane biogenesis lipoprotein LolB